MTYSILPATRNNVLIVLESLHCAFKPEVAVFAKEGDLLTVLLESVRQSAIAGVVFEGNKPVCLFGFRVLDDYTMPWMVATRYRPSKIVEFVRRSKKLMNSWSHKLLVNYVHKENHLALRYVRALGFSIGVTIKNFNDSDKTFLQIYKHRRS